MNVRPLSPVGVDLIDDKVRARLAEIQSAAGVAESQITLEVLYFLPKDFLNQYADMFTRAVKADGGESARNAAQQSAGEVGKARVVGSGGAKTGGKRYKKTFVVMDENALELKTRIDKRLRVIARDIAAGLLGEKVDSKAGQCSSCGMFLQTGWKFCPKDGTAYIDAL